MGPSPGNCLAAHRADLTLGKTAICIFAAKFYGRMRFFSPSQTLTTTIYCVCEQRRLWLSKASLLAYVALYKISCTNPNKHYLVNPSILQTTVASLMSQLSSQITPHSPRYFISTLPESSPPSTRRISIGAVDPANKYM